MAIVKRTGEHLHEPDEQQVECIALKAGVKRKARDTNDTTHHIIGDSLDTATESTVIKLPKLDSLKRTIRHERQTIDAAPVAAPGGGQGGHTFERFFRKQMFSDIFSEI